MNKYFKFLIIALAVVVIIPQVAFASWWNPASWGWVNRIFHFQQASQKQEQQTKPVQVESQKPNIVGNDRDAHGCIGSAGYTWCEAKKKCLRVWEEKCDTATSISDATGGWKTYTNVKYNFSFSYPSYLVSEILYDYNYTNASSTENGIRLSSPDTDNYSLDPDAIKMGLNVGIAGQMNWPLYNFFIESDIDPKYSTKIEPWIDSSLCKQMKEDNNMPLILEKEEIGNYNFCVIDRTKAFLKGVKLSKNDKLWELSNEHPEVDYIVFNPSGQSFRITLISADAGYKAAKTIFNGGDVDGVIKKIENDLVAREKIVKQIISTFKFTNQAESNSEAESNLDMCSDKLKSEADAIKSRYPESVLPTTVGQCSKTVVLRVGTRLSLSSNCQNISGSGSKIEYTNGLSQVSYETESGIENSRMGDEISLCLVSIPKKCPPGDNRGKYYKATNLRTGEVWSLPDSEHGCGGA